MNPMSELVLDATAKLSSKGRVFDLKTAYQAGGFAIGSHFTYPTMAHRLSLQTAIDSHTSLKIRTDTMMQDGDVALTVNVSPFAEMRVCCGFSAKDVKGGCYFGLNFDFKL